MAELAEAMQKQCHKTITQQTVSAAVKAENRWRKLNPDLGLPQIPTRGKKPQAMDPAVIDLGQRTRKDTQRQRRTADS